MKKILVVLLVGIFALAVSSHALTPGKVAIGIDTAAANLGVANVNSFLVRYNFTKQIAGQLGINYNSYKNVAGATTSQLGFSGRVNYMLPAAFGDAKPLVGLQYSTDGATASTSIISLLLGIEAEVAKGVLVTGGIIPFSTASVGGASDTTMTTGTGTTAMRGGFIGATVYVN